MSRYYCDIKHVVFNVSQGSDKACLFKKAQEKNSEIVLINNFENHNYEIILKCC